MAAVALDLTPIVDRLVARPFDDAALAEARASVNGHPQAYATTLRCAAKRARNTLAAAYWLTEAARVHDSIDDIGGAIALLTRAWDCDPGNAHTRELLAGYIARLSARVGLGFFGNPVPSFEPAPPAGVSLNAVHAGVESGIRPAPRQSARPEMDTLPGPFGTEGPDTVRAEAESIPPTARDAQSFAGTPSDVPAAVAPEQGEPAPGEETSDPDGNPLLEAAARSLMLPPSYELPLEPEPEPPTSPASEKPARSVPVSSEPELLGLSHDPLDELLPEDAYGDSEAPSTKRPMGDRLVGALFEALHELHFIDDVRSGANFVARILSEKTQAKTVLVHLFDLDKRQFVVVSAVGPYAPALLEWATPGDDPFVTEVMTEREAVVVLEPAQDPRFARGRFRLIEPSRSLLCAPAMYGARYLGLIELSDPLDGSEFTEDDRNALTYVADTFAQFVARHGVVLTEESPEPSSATAATDQSLSA